MAWRRVVLLAALIGLAACHSHPVHKPGDEYLKSIKFEGNKALSRTDLLTGLALHRTLSAERAPDPYQIQLDADRLRGQYSRLGYFESDVTVRTDRDKDAATVIYTIHEGPRSMTRVQISGLPVDPAVTQKAILDALPLKDGKPFDYDVYDLAKVPLLGVLQDAGYAHAVLDAAVTGDPVTHTAIIELKFTAGPKCTFGTVEVQGIDGDLKQAILARVKWTKGDVFSNKAVVATQREIYGLKRFSTVQVQPEAGTSAVVDMKIAVSESARHELTFGGGFGIDPIDYTVRARAGYVVSGWPAPLDTLTLDARPAYAYLRDGSAIEPRVRALAKIDRQDLFLTYAVGTVQVGYDYLTYEDVTQYGPEARLGYELRLVYPQLKLRVGYLFHQYDFRAPSPLVDDVLAAQLGINHSERIGVLQEALVADFRDNQNEPHLGIYAEINVNEGESFLGGNYTYQEIIPEVRGYVPLGPVVLAARARYGAIWGDVPPSERFFAGGANSNRGFGERQMSPELSGVVNGSSLTVPIGGAGLLDTNVEARIPIATIKTMPLHGVVFFDSGDVTNTPSELSLADLNYAVGLGLRLLTVVGPVRVDFGYRLNRTGDAPNTEEPGSSYAFHLSLGEAF